MNEEKTALQKVLYEKTEQIRSAIERAIEDGVKIEHSICVPDGYFIDGIFVQKSQTDITICLDMKSEKIAKVCEPSKDELEKKAAIMRAALEEIENQINAKQ